MQTVFEIFYVDRANGWAVAEYSFFERHQIGEARYCYHKQDAIAEAARWNMDKPRRIFGRNGSLQRTEVGYV